MPSSVQLEVWGGMGAAAAMMRERSLAVYPVHYSRIPDLFARDGLAADVALVSLARQFRQRPALLRAGARAHPRGGAAGAARHRRDQRGGPVRSRRRMARRRRPRAQRRGELRAGGRARDARHAGRPGDRRAGRRLRAGRREPAGRDRRGRRRGRRRPRRAAADDHPQRPLHRRAVVADQGRARGAARGRRSAGRLLGGLRHARPLCRGARPAGVPDRPAGGHPRHRVACGAAAVHGDQRRTRGRPCSGRSNAESIGGRYLGGIGGLNDFVRGALACPDGTAIVAIPSRRRAGKGEAAGIVAALSGPATIPAADADVFVSEHGVARLRGLSRAQRARALIGIAHPDDRPALERAAREQGLG